MAQVPTLAERCRSLLEQNWRAEHGCCVPNADVYPHQWLWDSCFHAIAWAGAGDERALAELASLFEGQLEDGFLPHMRYFAPDLRRGPLADRSSFTQPPVYALALEAAANAGFALPGELVERAGAALAHLWRSRRTADGLLVVHHPWETGCDDTPRWDSWVDGDPEVWEHQFLLDCRAVEDALFDHVGGCVGSRSFSVASSLFNTIAADAMERFGALAGDGTWRARADELAELVDAHLWDESQGLWVDRAYGADERPSTRLPTLDGALGLLTTRSRPRAQRVLARLGRADQFLGPYGFRYLPADHDLYRSRAYWRGPAWPQLQFLVWLALRRIGEHGLADEVRAATTLAVERSGLAEYYDAETGEGLGARPQTWAAVVLGFDLFPGAGARHWG